MDLLPLLDKGLGIEAEKSTGPGPYISLITKVTRICNLRCTYCHEWADTKSVLEFETIAHLTAKSLRVADMRSVRFIWHGGEPLVRGRDFYKKALFLQDQTRRDGQTVINGLQTNGTLVDEEWARFFHDHHFEVGLSLDGPRSLHDQQRPTADRRGSWDKAMRAVQLFREHNVPFGALIVVSDETIRLGADAMFAFLIENGVNCFAMLHLRPESRPDGMYDPGSDYVALDRFNRYQMRMFDLWFAHNDPDIHIREFDSILSMLLGGNASVCTLAGGCIGKHFGVNVNGDIYHCDRYVSDNDYRLGNIVTDDWGAIFSREEIRVLQERNRKRLAGYVDCSYLPICHGGCPHNYYIDRRSIRNFDGRCCGEASLIAHIRQRLSESLDGSRIGVALTGALSTSNVNRIDVQPA